MTGQFFVRLARWAALVGCGLFLGLGVAGSQVQANFRIGEDSFSISNAPGYCFAMVAFSRWYYLSKESAPPLRKVVSPIAQQRIARELQEFYSRNLIKIQADYCNLNHSKPSESFRRFLLGLLGGDPQIVLLMNKGSQGAVLHAVLAYEWVPERNSLKIYDPNYTKEERFLDLDRKLYTSLDISYNSICFPEVLNDHPGLVNQMQRLYVRYVAKREDQRLAGPIFRPSIRQSQSN
jgi:hypothetical protein